jgi:type II secretory pathway pseudopilin PulG
LPQPQEKTSDAVEKLPNPELNPLLNPTLGRNLGRWAQAYFTTPPEKREQAITELLRELEAERPPVDSSQVEPSTPPGWLRRVEAEQLVLRSLSCAECGHQNDPQQRYCGMCGSPLSFDEPLTDAAPLHDSRADVGPVESAVEPVAAPISEHEFGTLSLFASVDEPRSEPAPTPISEVHWLQDKNLRAGDAFVPQRSVTTYAVAVLGVLLVAALFYAQSRTQKRSSSTTASASEAIRQPEAQSQQAVAGNPSSGKQSTTLTTTPAQNPPPPATSPTPRPSVQPANVAQSSIPPAKGAAADSVRNATTGEPESPNPGAGSVELAAAEGFLTGKYGPRDSAEAAKLLWKAVGKENTTAILLLSDLYLAGDGVPKSCDQARLLLSAAARKNVAQAAEKLGDLRRAGCP